MQRSPRRGNPSEVFQFIQTRLNTYALAASAAGVGVLALAQPTQASVVYTPTHQVIGANGVYNLELAGDGAVNFLIQEWVSGFTSNNALLCDAAIGNGVVGKAHFASALSAGASIGPNQKFVAGGNNGEVMFSVTHTTTNGTSFVHGVWANVRNRYLGLKFQFSGETHYSWARVSVKRVANHFTAVLTGYAYETTPNTAIVAGQTSGNAVDSSGDANSENSESPVGAASANSAGSARYKSLGDIALGALGAPERRQP
jgi:hypothetical protein